LGWVYLIRDRLARNRHGTGSGTTQPQPQSTEYRNRKQTLPTDLIVNRCFIRVSEVLHKI